MTTEFRRMQQRRGSAAQWGSNDAVPFAGEIALQTGPGTGEARAKVGDGITAFSALPWVFEVDAVARAAIAATDSVVVSLDSRMTAVEAAISGGGSVAALQAQVASNTAQIALRQPLLPIGTNLGDVLFWNGTTYSATVLAPAPILGTILYWDPVAGAYVGTGAGSPGQALVLTPAGIPAWTTNPAAGVAEAPNDGRIFARQSEAWIDLPPAMSCTVVTEAGGAVTLNAGHAGAHILCTSPTGCEVEVPNNSTVPFPIGTIINLEQRDATNFVEVQWVAGVNVRFIATRAPHTSARYGVMTLTKTGTNEWNLRGDLT